MWRWAEGFQATYIGETKIVAIEQDLVFNYSLKIVDLCFFVIVKYI